MRGRTVGGIQGAGLCSVTLSNPNTPTIELDFYQEISGKNFSRFTWYVIARTLSNALLT